MGTVLNSWKTLALFLKPLRRPPSTQRFRKMYFVASTLYHKLLAFAIFLCLASVRMITVSIQGGTLLYRICCACVLGTNANDFGTNASDFALHDFCNRALHSFFVV